MWAYIYKYGEIRGSEICIGQLATPIAPVHAWYRLRSHSMAPAKGQCFGDATKDLMSPVQGHRGREGVAVGRHVTILSG